MKKKKLTTFGKTLFALLIVAAIAIVLVLVKPWDRFKSAAPIETAEASASASASAAPTVDPSQTADYQSRKNTNPDYVGELAFESGLVDQNVVQSTDNDKYLNLSWDLQTSTHGAAFMDYRNTMDDQNLIIYGHFVYLDESLMFSPLHQLKDQANYEANKYIDLKLEDTTRKYLVTDVFYYEMDNENLMYYYTAYSSDYFNTYYTNVKAADFYDTGESLTMDDHWLTLQTCVRDRDDLRLIVLAKEVTE